MTARKLNNHAINHTSWCNSGQSPLGHRHFPATFSQVDHPLIRAMAPLIEVLGARVVEPANALASDIALQWEGEHVASIRLPQLQGALDRLIDQVERELGGTLSELSREDKQRAVKMLDDRGAFELRRSVEDVADSFGVSRITIYNYLNAIRDR
jgi:HTH domain